MGRKRTRYFDLPPRMQAKGRHYYYVSNGKWRPLGANLETAKLRWAELEGVGGESVADLCRRYVAREERPAGTLKQYRSYIRAIEEAFPIRAGSLTSQHVALWRETQYARRAYCNGVLAVLVAATRLGEELGVCRAIHVSRWKVEGRDILPEGDEAQRVAAKGPPWLKTAVDIAEVIGPRISDILAMQWSDVRDGMLYMRAKKTVYFARGSAIRPCGTAP